MEILKNVTSSQMCYSRDHRDDLWCDILVYFLHEKRAFEVVGPSPTWHDVLLFEAQTFGLKFTHFYWINNVVHLERLHATLVIFFFFLSKLPTRFKSKIQLSTVEGQVKEMLLRKCKNRSMALSPWRVIIQMILYDIGLHLFGSLPVVKSLYFKSYLWKKD